MKNYLKLKKEKSIKTIIKFKQMDIINEKIKVMKLIIIIAMSLQEPQRQCLNVEIIF